MENINEFLDGIIFIMNNCTKVELLISIANFIHLLAYDETGEDIDSNIDNIFSMPAFFNSFIDFIKTSDFFRNINSENLKINYAYYQILTDWGSWAKDTNCDCDIIREMFKTNLLEYITNFIKNVHNDCDLYEETCAEYGSVDILNNLVLIIGGFEIYYEPLCLILIEMIKKFKLQENLNEVISINILYLLHFSKDQNLIEFLSKIKENDRNCLMSLINSTEVVSKDVLNHLKVRILNIENQS